MAITLDGTNGVTYPNGDTQNDVVGTVSQSSGLPTGAVFESGSNSNGSYIKFADGTMICYLSQIENRNGTGTFTINVTFPQTFAESPLIPPYNSAPVAVNATLFTTVPGTATGIGVSAITTSSVNVNIQRTNSTPTVFFLMVIGKWF